MQTLEGPQQTPLHQLTRSPELLLAALSWSFLALPLFFCRERGDAMRFPRRNSNCDDGQLKKNKGTNLQVLGPIEAHKQHNHAENVEEEALDMGAGVGRGLVDQGSMVCLSAAQHSPKPSTPGSCTPQCESGTRRTQC